MIILLGLPGWATALIIVVPVVIIIGLLIGGYNTFVKKRNKTQEAYSTMDVHLKKRYDLIPNLVNCVKGYAKHEKETLEKVISARNMAQSSTTVTDKIANENILSGTLKSLFAISEAYPDLKANTQFLDLQQQLKQIEKDIASARTYYNAVVNDFNTTIESFPSNILAKMCKFKRLPLFEIDGTMRENVEVKFE